MANTTILDQDPLSSIPGDAIMYIVVDGQDFRTTKDEFLGAYKDIFLGSVNPTSTPAGTTAAMWIATEPGTYTNFGGVVVSENSIAVISRSETGDFTISQTEIELGDYAKKREFSNVFSSGKNLFNKDAAVVGKYISIDNGVSIVNDAGFSYSAFVKILSNQQYAISGAVAYVLYYDVDKTFLSAQYISSNFTTPSNCEYVIIDWISTNLNVLQLEIGSTATAYSPFVLINKLKGSEIETESIGGDKLMPSAVDLSKTNFGIPSINLFNKEVVINNKYYNSDNGILVNDLSLCASQLIAIESSEDYILKHPSYLSFFDSNRVFISGTSEVGSFTAPSTASYVGISFLQTFINTQQLEKGLISTFYRNFGSKINPLLIQDPLVFDYYIVSKNGNGQFTTIAEAVDKVPAGATILVMPGEYKEFVICGSKEINIVGLDKEKCVLYHDSGKYEETPLYINKGSVQNMTIKSIFNPSIDYSAISNFSYAVHIDLFGANGKLLVDNCIITSDFNNAMGCGATENHKLNIKNCDVKATNNSGLVSAAVAFAYHGSTVGTQSEISLNRNRFKGIAYDIFLQSDGTANNIGVNAFFNIGANVNISYLNTAFFLGADNFGNQSEDLN